MGSSSTRTRILCEYNGPSYNTIQLSPLSNHAIRERLPDLTAPVFGPFETILRVLDCTIEASVSVTFEQQLQVAYSPSLPVVLHPRM